jgi:competence protein ComEA
MNRIKKLIRDVFGFSRTEINGFIILLPLAVVIVSAVPLYSSWLAKQETDFSNEKKHLDSVMTLFNTHEKKMNDSVLHVAPVLRKERVFFPFNPNKASVTELKKLGFTEILSTRIASYRSSGGVFSVKSDLLKIYGMDPTFYQQLYTYIELPEKNENKKPLHFTGAEKNVTHDLNTADSVQLSSVYGIGPKLAARIIKFRNALGGFTKHEQLKEVYGLDSTVVNSLSKAFLIRENFEPVKINLNTASEAELSSHPYIKKKIAKAIIAYRFQHGNFSSVDEIGKLTIVKPDEAKRLTPYLKIFD